MPRHPRGLLDTSVVIDLEYLSSDVLADENAIAAVTLAELAAGPHATNDAAERARRQDRLQRAEATFDALPFDREAARAYARIFATQRAAGRSSRTRLANFLIAATAMANALPLYTRNPEDFSGLHELLEIVEV